MIREYRTAILTGASYGIGPYIAHALAQTGFQLVVAARSEAKLDAVAAELRANGVPVVPVPTDVTDPVALAHLVAVAEAECGPVDVVINNAGGDPQREFHNLHTADVEQIIRLNLISAIELTRLVLPGMMTRRRGHIVNMSSMGGWIGFPHTEVYAACKHGLVGFTRVLRADYGKDGIGASVLILGAIWGAGITTRTIEETGLAMPPLAKAFASSPTAVAQAVICAIRYNKAELVVMPGPGKLIKLQLDLFPRLGVLMNRLSGVAPLMKHIADIREQHHRHART